MKENARDILTPFIGTLDAICEKELLLAGNRTCSWKSEGTSGTTSSERLLDVGDAAVLKQLEQTRS